MGQENIQPNKKETKFDPKEIQNIYEHRKRLESENPDTFNRPTDIDEDSNERNLKSKESDTSVEY